MGLDSSKLFFITLVLISCFSCGKTEDIIEEQVQSLFVESLSSNYFQHSEHIQLNVYYQIGAEPFTGSRATGGKLWDITKDNLKQIFSYRSRSPALSIPDSLEQMSVLHTANKQTWSTEDILNLVLKNNKGGADKKSAVFYIYFLNGYSDKGKNIIGLQVGQYPIIALFKDVIKNSGNQMVQNYVEQSTIVHEMGHALGFVNHGVPMKTPHQDKAHGAHTTNEDCVMYWSNEGASDLSQFVVKYITSGNTEMWGPEVLNDVKEFSR